LTSVVQKRFNFQPGSVELFAERVQNRALCAIAQAESLRYKLLGGLAVRRACYGVLRFIMENKAKGCEITVSGKLRAQRAKSMKFRDGYMLKSGNPVRDFVDSAVRHVMLRQGVLGVKVKIMLPSYSPQIKGSVKKPQPDVVTVNLPKDIPVPTHPVATHAPGGGGGQGGGTGGRYAASVGGGAGTGGQGGGFGGGGGDGHQS